jgi:TolB-like protein
VPSVLSAQCPDGTPPPCAATARRAAPRQAPPPAAERARRFLVLPFRNLSRSPEYDWLVEGSPVLITDALSRNDAVTVVPDERLYPALQRAGLTPGAVMDLARVRRIASETGGWTAVTGEILAFGDRVRVSARAFDVVSNAEVLRAVEEAAPGEDVRAVYQRLGTRLIRSAGVREAGAADLVATTTGSLDAYRAYVRGVMHANRSEPRRARDAFREAVRLDSGYAQAYVRLAEAELGVDPRQIINPQSALYRSAARAAELAANLPPHDRELVLAINDLVSVRFTSARERLERLLAQDSLNVDALEWRSSLELFDPILVPSGGGERPRGSINAGLRLAKRALELDPSRHRVYGALVQSYLLAGGGTPGFTMGYRREAASLPALLNTLPERTFIPLLRDTIVLVPTDSIATVPGDTLAAARRRAVDAARQWSQRWLAAGPNEADAHLWASRAHALAGDYALALRELETADSLGVETGLENVPARRMALLARLERYADGTRVADSLWNAGALNVSNVTAYQIEGVGWAFLLFALEHRYDRAAALLEGLAVVLAPAAMANPQLPADALAAALLGGHAPTYFLAPALIRVRVVDRMLDDVHGLPAGPLARLLPFQVSILLNDTAIADRPALAARVVATANRIASTHPDLAYQLAMVAREDSTMRRTVDSLPWYAPRRRALEEERLATQRRFRPLRAVVTDSAAAFSWSVEGDTFRWNRVETGPGEQDFRWTAEFDAGGSRYEALATAGGRPGVAPTTGRLTELLTASFRVLREIPTADTTAARRVVSRTAVRLEPEPGGFRVVVREPRIVAALRSERPATVRMRFLPCATQADGARVCVDEQVGVTYP